MCFQSKVTILKCVRNGELKDDDNCSLKTE